MPKRLLPHRRKEPLSYPRQAVKGGMDTDRLKSVLMDIADTYVKRQVPRGAAALAYYLTMTIFPVLICLYTMLGTRYNEAMQALNILQDIMATETYQAIEDFLSYVAANNNRAMLVAALIVLVTSASASFRSFESTVGELQGEVRFRGFFGYLFSFVLSIAFLAVMYIAVLIMMTGSWFVDLVQGWLPTMSIDASWTWFRFIVLFGVVFLQIWFLYRVTVPRRNVYRILPGALIATAALVGVCIVFSAFIAVSARYPLVYGSLASVILLMFWLYLCSLMIIMGEVVNIVLRDHAAEGN